MKSPRARRDLGSPKHESTVLWSAYSILGQFKNNYKVVTETMVVKGLALLALGFARLIVYLKTKSKTCLFNYLSLAVATAAGSRDARPETPSWKS